MGELMHSQEKAEIQHIDDADSDDGKQVTAK